MNKELLYFNGLYGDLNAKHGSDYIFSELIKTRSETFDWVVRPHIHNHLFQIFCVESGKVKFHGNHYEKNLEGPFLILIPPMAIHGFSYSKDVKGRILTISDSYVENAFPIETPILSKLTKPEFIHNFYDRMQFKQILDLILQIDREIFSERLEQTSMVQALVCQLFIVLYRFFNANQTIEKPDSLYLRHFNQFQKILKGSVKIKTINELARELNITPIHLNRICKIIARKSALQIVHEHIIMEAEKYLKHTSLTIAEIAYILNFDYPNYFSKLFKKYNKISPIEFRKDLKNLEK